MSRMVHCAKLGAELPGVSYKPFINPLGQRIYDTISQDAWLQWVEFSKKILNEYRLDPMSAQAQKMLLEQAEEFLFGTAAPENPPEFVPPRS